jgi:hypothetical protein
MREIKTLLILLICISALGSCRKIEHLSSVPRVEFTSFAIFDTTILDNNAKGGRLKFYFEDGDGNIGLNPPSGTLTETTNLFFTLFRKSGGIMEIAPENDPLKPYPFRIPYMERVGVNKILKGTISVTFLYFEYAQGDTIRYDFYLKDRALNESNVESTGEIILSVNGIYKKN